MVAKVLLLGRPGSGKSSAACLIEMYASANGWLTHHINDYQLLQEMFLLEKAQQTSSAARKFRPTGPEEYNGFDVIDFSVLDTVLTIMEKKVWEEKCKLLAENRLFLIEFARANYSEALQQFSSVFLQSSYFIYLNVDVKTCVQRIHQRVADPMRREGYDHFVSDEIMRNYYREDDWPYILLDLKQNRDFRVKEINNAGSIQDLTKVINDFVVSLLQKEEFESQTRLGKNILISTQTPEKRESELIGIGTTMLHGGEINLLRPGSSDVLI